MTIGDTAAPGVQSIPAYKTRKLGRGLSALIGEPVAVNIANDHADSRESVGYQGLPQTNTPTQVMPQPPTPNTTATPGRSLLNLSVEAIEPSPFQPREIFSPEALRELADSIRVAGVMQPIVVRRRFGTDAGSSGGVGSGEVRYELIAGERRWRAARLVGLSTVPAVLVQLSDEEAAQWGLIENLQRADLSAIEKARAFQRLVVKFGLTHEQVAQRVGVDRTSVSNHVRLLELEPSVLELLAQGRLSFGHARALLGTSPGSDREHLASRVAEEGWSVRILEDFVAGQKPIADMKVPTRLASKSTSPAARAVSAPQVDAIEKQLSDYLGTKVRLRTTAGGKRGRMTIEFYSLDHFDGLLQRIGAKLDM